MDPAGLPPQDYSPNDKAAKGRPEEPHPPAVPVLRVLHLINTLNPAAGGPSESVRLLLSSDRAQYRGEAVTMDAPDAPFLNHPFPVHALGPVHNTYGFNTRLRPWLRANLHRFDFVVVNGLWQYIGFCTLHEVSGKLPYFVFTHGMLDPYFKRRFPLKHLKKWVYWLIVEYWVLRKAARVLFTTTAEAQLAKQSFFLHHWNPLVVPYGAATPPADSAESREAFLDLCPQLRNRRFLIYFGRIHPKKGCDLLIRAFANVAALEPDLLLVMVGPDHQDYTEKLKRMAARCGIADRVLWPGLVTGPAKWGALRSAEAFILPSHQENFGIAVAEALGCSAPVLVSDKVAIAEEICADGAGFMESDTTRGTEKLIRRWIETPIPQRAAMRRQAIQTFETRYNMDRASEVILQQARQHYRNGHVPHHDIS